MNTIGRYQIAEKLGQGGMGVVYRAFDPLLQRVVAVKLIGTLEANDELRERFFREARAAGQLSHKNIITIHDLGEHEGQPFLAMEFLEGQDLQHRMAGHAKMSLARKLELAIEICDGIEYAHVHGVIHRDIKPANIFITSSGTAKILDFGLARLITSELTNSNMMMGTLNYMSPEQVRGERADHRSDIFSTGVVLYEVLGGRKAFEGDSFGATLYKILQEVPEPLPNIDATLPPELVAIVEHALEKARDERYQHMSEMARDLTAYRQQLMLMNSPTFGRPTTGIARAPSDSDAPTIAGLPVRPLPAVPPGSGSSPASEPAPPAAAGRPPWRRVAALAAATVVLLGALVTWIITRDSPPPPQTAGTKADAPAVATEQAIATRLEQASPAKQVAETVTRSLANARDLFESGRFDEASRAAGEVLAVDPGNAEAKRLMDEGATRSRGKGAEEARARMAAARNAAAAAQTEAAARTARARLAQADRKAADPPPATPVPASTGLPLPSATPPVPPPTAPPPAATQQTPPAETAPQPVPPTSGINEVLDRYKTALENRSLESLKRLWPSLGGAQESAIRREFQNANRIDVEIVNRQITVNGTSASVSFIRRYELHTVDKQRLRTETRTTMNLQRTGTTWIIDQIRFEPVR